MVIICFRYNLNISNVGVERQSINELMEHKQITIHGMGNLEHGMRQVQPSEGIKSINRILILPKFFVTFMLTVFYYVVEIKVFNAIVEEYRPFSSCSTNDNRRVTVIQHHRAFIWMRLSHHV